MVKLRHFHPFKVLVLGDFMLDTYTTGRVKRISPEAPVPVMEVLKQESRPGGAGNVVLNLLNLGASVFALGRIGNDSEGEELKQLLGTANCDSLLIEPGYRTPVKNRLIADSQQLIRVDHEKITTITDGLEEIILEKIEGLIATVDVVAISDYGKGFLSNRIIQTTIELAKRAKIPTIVDPKGTDFTKYQGATVVKPNLTEAYAAAKCPASASLELVAKNLDSIADILLITRSELGISVFQSGKRTDFPVRSKEVKDVTGAGDTVLSILSLAFANGLEIAEAAELANIAAGLAIERLGCVQITLSELAERLLEVDVETKIFDDSHTYALQQVLKGKKYSILALEKEQEMSNTLFHTIRELSSKEKLIIYVPDSEPNDELIHLLSSLPEIDYIILQQTSLKNLCRAITPHEVYLLKQNRQIQLAKDLLSDLRGAFSANLNDARPSNDLKNSPLM